ncbi:hypothetical protein EZV73_21135 [Acidaminobacter sp. JC074]|uniref:FAD binding domain-containing protein n=1 Tax=Acidaminobacter sp. JC074 TaxID=2530199 RepID=UPI001F0F2FF8|nr:FAD binding domain-containing protein [Acidaminobacter sp. JC074]MCH4890098.1 hypothetical protein [Acidaminobacter sp. JC074]
MINFDFDYYKASDLKSAYDLYKDLTGKGKKVFYYAGGTELITSFRKGTIKADALIDIKDIEGIKTIRCEEEVVLGGCLTLNEIIETHNIDILKEVLIHIGDHTVRNAITIGGNICGRLPYKEAILPLLALDADIVTYGEQGLREVKLRDLFDKRLKLSPGEILYQIKYLNKRITYGMKRYTETTSVDYPIVHVFVRNDSEKSVAVSGYCSYPLFKVFSNESLEGIKGDFESFGKDDKRASKAYKKHLFEEALDSIFREMEDK